MSIASKFRTLHKIISNGQYGAIPWRILANILPGEIVRNMIHYSLSRKYRDFIAAHTHINQQNCLPRGGGLTV